MLRCAVVVLAATVGAAITIPDTLISRYVLLVGVGVAALLAIFAPRPAAEQHVHDAPIESVDVGRLTAGTLTPQVAVGRVVTGPRVENRHAMHRGPYDADDPDVAHLVPPQARRRADRA